MGDSYALIRAYFRKGTFGYITRSALEPSSIAMYFFHVLLPKTEAVLTASVFKKNADT